MQNNNQQGFTLVELLIASVIIAVGILAWASTQQSAIKNRAMSNDITVASEMAIAKLEELTLKCQYNPEKDDGPSSPGEKNTVHGVDFYLNWTVSDQMKLTFTNATGIAMWQVNTSVSWNRYGNKNLQYQRLVLGE